MDKWLQAISNLTLTKIINFLYNHHTCYTFTTFAKSTYWNVATVSGQRWLNGNAQPHWHQSDMPCPNNRFICVNLSSELWSVRPLECVKWIKKLEFSLWKSGIEFFFFPFCVHWQGLSLYMMMLSILVQYSVIICCNLSFDSILAISYHLTVSNLREYFVDSIAEIGAWNGHSHTHTFSFILHQFCWPCRKVEKANHFCVNGSKYILLYCLKFTKLFTTFKYTNSHMLMCMCAVMWFMDGFHFLFFRLISSAYM